MGENVALGSLALLLAGLALLISGIGFYRTVYFVSLGYAFSIVAMALVAPILTRHTLTWAAAAQNALLILWGLRLGIYLLRRESSASYRKELLDVQQRGAGIGALKKILIWLGVSLLYVAMFSPSLFHLTGAAFLPAPFASLLQALGLLTMAGGLLLEALADRQKSRFKAQSPGQFCNVGLYRLSRCPNYLGEILFWAGNWVAGLAFYASLPMAILSLIGLVCIVLIMLGSTKRLERMQGERYGQRPEYQSYVTSVPILVPFVPVYSLQGIRVYLE